MSRNLSANLKSEAYALESAEPVIELLKVSSPTLANPIYLAKNTEPVVTTTPDNATWQPFPFTVEFPEEADSVVVRAKVRVDAVAADREIVIAVRQASLLQVELRVVRASTPDIIEFQTPPLEWRQVTHSPALGVLEGELFYGEDFNVEPFGAQRFTPPNFPGGF